MTANRLIKIREEKKKVCCAVFPYFLSKETILLLVILIGKLSSCSVIFLSSRKMPFGDFSSKIKVVFNKDTLRDACPTNFSTNFESWWQGSEWEKGERQKLHCVQNENQKEIVGQSKGQQIFF